MILSASGWRKVFAISGDEQDVNPRISDDDKSISIAAAKVFYDYIKAGNPFDACYSIVENYYRGNSTTQLRIKDLHEREEII